MEKVAIPKPKKKKMEHLFEVKQEASGLCSCCNSFKDCTYPKDPERSILQCEEFEGIVPYSLKVASHGKITPEGLEKTPGSVMSDSNPDRGLCSLCENRTTCTYPRPETGVWHCEEYR